MVKNQRSPETKHSKIKHRLLPLSFCLFLDRKAKIALRFSPIYIYLPSVKIAWFIFLIQTFNNLFLSSTNLSATFILVFIPSISC